MTAESGHVPSHAQHRALQPRRTESALARLAEVVDPGDWVRHAACSEHEPNWWWPDSPDGRSAEQVEVDKMAALDICRECLVRRDCARYALDTKAKAGIWGGVVLSDSPGSGYTSARERQAAAQLALQLVAR